MSDGPITSARTGRGDGAELPVLTTVAEIDRLIQTTGELFLDVGRHPVPPRDLESGYRLPGTPCYALVPEPWWLDSTATWVARQLVDRASSGAASEAATGGPHARLVVGAVVGRCAAGRLLVAPMHPLATLGPEAVRDAHRAHEEWRRRIDLTMLD